MLVVGFTDLSQDFMVPRDFLGPVYFSVSFGHVTSLVFAKLILGPFRGAVFPNCARFPAGSGNYLTTFFNDPHRHRGRYSSR